MKKKEIDYFFNLLSKELDQTAKIILSGAAAGTILGRVRASFDIDFAIDLVSHNPQAWTELKEAIDRTIKKTNIAVNYAEDIDRWGMITLLDYKKHATSYRKFGRLQVLVMDPVYWSIGKITRYINSDEKDLLHVFKKKKVPIKSLMGTWRRALRSSPKSTALQTFINHAKHFLSSHGQEIWGEKFNSEKELEKLMS